VQEKIPLAGSSLDRGLALDLATGLFLKSFVGWVGCWLVFVFALVHNTPCLASLGYSFMWLTCDLSTKLGS